MASCFLRDCINMDETRIAAFTEYVLRPLVEDWRKILEELRSLNIGITQQTVKQACFALGLWHVLGEVIRAVCYVLIVWIVCHTVLLVW